ncbi:hypothetical protein C5469_16205 [Photorhabdus cinerea]|uniref:Putative tail fiber protein gp53-like C-terminal domain-containing protein n=1 Tax=Photorhabdus cinerea TaxID=471575 RepID=A0A7X5TH99_9GAMM|nr:hypothetical protein [Photorhabdus cinerea]
METVALAKNAFPKSGGVVNGNVDATGYISGKGVYEAPGVRVYSSINKPSPGELGAYTTGECNGRFQLKGSGLLSIDADNARFNGHVLAWLDEVDRNYQPRGNYQPAGNYAPMGQSYTKPESDSRYGSKNTALKSTNGWWKCGDTGMIYQWANHLWYAGQSLNFNFPISFPNAVFGIVLSDNIGYQPMGTTNRSRTGFTLTGNQSVLSFYYLAVGY